MISTLMLRKYFCLIIFFLLILVFPVETHANNKNLVNIYFFHSKDCTHCQSEMSLLNSLEDEYDNIKIYRYEMHEGKNNENRLKVQDLYDIKNNGVPLTVIGDTPYIGYLVEKSPIIFIKTIEYYSKYGYSDRVGELLKLEKVSNYKAQNAPTLEKFSEDYGNYKLIGSLYTNELDLSICSFILGILSQFNLIKILTIILVIIILIGVKDLKKELYIFSIYSLFDVFFDIIYLIINNTYIWLIYLIIIVLFVLGIVKFFGIKKIYYIYIGVLIIICNISNFFENYLYAYSEIFQELMRLNNLNGLNQISYYGNYVFVISIISIIFVFLFYIFKNNFFVKKIS